MTEFMRNLFVSLLAELFVAIITILVKERRQRVVVLILGTVIAGIIGFGPQLLSRITPSPSATIASSTGHQSSQPTVSAADQQSGPKVLTSSDFGPLLYEDNFDEDREAWSLRQGSSIRDGVLTIKSDTQAWINSDIQYSDFIFETEFRPNNPTGNSEIDVYLRFQVPPCPNWNCSIQIWVGTDWKTVGARRFGGIELIRILSDISVPQLDSSAWNKLTIIVKGNEFQIFVNNAFVTSFTDSTFRSGKFGLSSEAGDTAVNFVHIYALP